MATALPDGIERFTAPIPPQRRVDMKVILLGEPEVGKTSVWKCLRDGGRPLQLKAHVETQDADFWAVPTVLTHTPPTPLVITCWDTAGQERYRSLISSYASRVQVALLVFDMTKEHTFGKLLDTWLPFVQQYSPDAHRIYVGNKSDMTTSHFSATREQLTRRLSAADPNADYLETSCQNGSNIGQLFVRMRAVFIEHDDSAQAYLRGGHSPRAAQTIATASSHKGQTVRLDTAERAAQKREPCTC